MKPRVGLDVDGVLADLLTHCLGVASRMIGRRVTVEEVTSYDFAFVPESQTRTFWREVGAPGVCKNLRRYPGAVEGVKKLREVAEVYCVTSHLQAGSRWVHEREFWLKKHFDIPNAKVVHTHAKYTFAGAMLIDDKPKNIEEWAREHPKGTPVLWAQPYNASHTFPADVAPRIVRTNDWDHVVRLVPSTYLPTTPSRG